LGDLACEQLLTKPCNAIQQQCPTGPLSCFNCTNQICPSSYICDSGTGDCVCSTLCGQTCCSPDQTCTSGTCVTNCPSGETRCGTTCCPSSQMCSNGQCVNTSCPSGDVVCGANCCSPGSICIAYIGNGGALTCFPPGTVPCSNGDACLPGIGSPVCCTGPLTYHTDTCCYGGSICCQTADANWCCPPTTRCATTDALPHCL